MDHHSSHSHSCHILANPAHRSRTMTQVEFTLPSPYFAAGHYMGLIKTQVNTWAQRHGIADSEYTIRASGDRKYRLILEFANQQDFTLWALSWDNSNLPDWLVIK